MQHRERPIRRRAVLAQAAAIVTLVATLIGTAPAVANQAVSPVVKKLEIEWENIKFKLPEGQRKTALMNALGEEADAATAAHPRETDVLIWDGIITSERASMVGPFSALKLIGKARDILERAYRIDPAALDAGATTTLGVIYSRVPGFPIAFGDKQKARRLLEQAVHLAPDGLDALYFYGDFLYSEKEYPQARVILRRALASPRHPDRPLWDANRRVVARELLAKMQDKGSG